MRQVAQLLNIPYTTYVNYEKGVREPNFEMLIAIANMYSVSVDYLLGRSGDTIDDRILDIVNTIDSDILENCNGNLNIAQHLQNKRNKLLANSPDISEDFVTFPVIGEVAAGYDHIAMEDWTGDTVNIPQSFLKGRSKEEFFVLRITGDSMYPAFQNGDKVLVLRQSTLNHSGQVGVVIYNGDTGTIKRIEYVLGEDWMKLIPINPNYPPVRIEGAALQDCRVIGIPKLLIREIEE